MPDLIEVEAELCSRELVEFFRQAWPIIEPGVPFGDGWHIEAIAEHLSAVSRGEIRNLLINIPPRHALALGTEVPTPEGFKLIEDIESGDYVFGLDGTPTRVVGRSEIYEGERFKVTTDDGASVVCDAEHLWTVRLDRKHEHYRTYTTRQLYERQGGAYLRYLRSGELEISYDRHVSAPRPPRLPASSPAQYPERSLEVDPYLLGLWLGDGTASGGSITMSIEDATPIRAKLAALGIETTDRKKSITFGVLGLQAKLRKLGLLDNKHIPQEYLFSSVEQRMELLRGLMDTDGNVSVDRQCFFSNTNLRLINETRELLSSLAIKNSLAECRATLYGVDHGPYWRISFYAKGCAFLQRKNCRALGHIKSVGRYIKIQPQGIGPVRCIEVEREDGVFLVGRGYLPTHNSKSSLCAVMWPAWEWTFNPSSQWLFACYAQDLSTRDSLSCRRLIQSPWYQERWGKVFQLAGDQNLKTRFENTARGRRLATGVEGVGTGEGGSRIVIDDPHNMKEIQSDIIRESVISWWRTSMSTRLNNPKTDARVIVMQRGHELDLSGYVIKESDHEWEHLMLPGEFEPGRRCKTRVIVKGQANKFLAPGKSFEDPRTVPGSLLCPSRFGPKEMLVFRKELGEYGYAAQIQQRPAPEGGGILKRKYWREWKADKLPVPEFVLQSYDTAYEEGERNDYTARTTWGVFWHSDTDDSSAGRWCALLLEAKRERMPFPKLREDAMRSYREYKPDLIIVEKAGAGISLVQELRKKIPIRMKKVKGDKVSRAHLASLFLEQGCVFFVQRHWAEEVIRECEIFDAGEHDDYVDSCTLAWKYLRETFHLGLRDDDKEEDEQRDERPRKFYG